MANIWEKGFGGKKYKFAQGHYHRSILEDIVILKKKNYGSFVSYALTLKKNLNAEKQSMEWWPHKSVLLFGSWKKKV